MNKIISTAIFSFALVFCQSAFSYTCDGKVQYVTISPDGGLNMSLTNINNNSSLNLSWVHLCNVSTTYNAITPNTCNSIQSTLMAAKLSDRAVRLWFSDASNDCTNTAHPAWYPLLNWYFGPALI